jgi:3,4-dihydroxy 2-butanone 4-phosphate synthase/GTP cyclohydrolase II
MNMPISTTEEIISALRQGEMIILMDDEDRENEGDLVMAATKVHAENINFMARYGRGLICLTLTQERCAQLRLPLMVSDNSSKLGTNFTISIEAAQGVTTGISAADRAHTVRTATAQDARHTDLVQPGHIFPLMAQPGGVLTRAGHTEAGCDLARLAGLEPAAVIVEILNEDGTMARRPDLEIFAVKHGLKMGTIADLIHYRALREHTVERAAECNITTEFGEFRLVGYRDTLDEAVHLALVRGTVQPDVPTLVRVHLQDSLSDLMGGQRHDIGLSLRGAMQRIANEDAGVIVVLRKPETTTELLKRIQDQHLQYESMQAGSANLRMFGIGAQILSDLGVRKMRVLGTPKKLHALSGFDLELVEHITHD